MKKMILTVATVLTMGLVNAQEFKENFLGEDFLMYKNSLLKLKSNENLYLDHIFYSDIKDCKDLYSSNVMYPKLGKTYLTEEDSLRNKVFKVENIIDKNGEVWDMKRKVNILEHPFFILRDTLTNKSFYFKYNESSEWDFPFITSEITLDENVLSNNIDRKTDDFTNEITIHSPYKISADLTKIIDKGKVLYYLGLKTSGSTPNVNKRGVTVLFSDGTKWVKNELIDVEVGDYGYKYSTFIRLTPIEVDMFINKEISKFRLYIYDNELEKSEAKKFKTFVKIIKSMK